LQHGITPTYTTATLTPRHETLTAVAKTKIKKVTRPLTPPQKPPKAAKHSAPGWANPTPKPAQTYEVASAASEPAPIPGYEVASATSKPEGAPRTASAVARANGSANDVINERGYWQGLPSAEPADAPQVARAAPPPTPRRA